MTIKMEPMASSRISIRAKEYYFRTGMTFLLQLNPQKIIGNQSSNRSGGLHCQSQLPTHLPKPVKIVHFQSEWLSCDKNIFACYLA